VDDNPYISRINRVIDYIDQHLDQPLSLATLAKVACFSECHFHRIFKSAVGENLAPYVKRRRLERAAYLLVHGQGRDLTEVGFACGFRSSSDFSRSFKKHFGSPPSAWIAGFESGLTEKRAPNFSGARRPVFTPGDNPDDFVVRIERWAASTLAYVSATDAYSPGQVYEAYQVMRAWATARGLGPEARWLGMSKDDPDITPAELYRFDLGVIVPDGTPPEGRVGIRPMPASAYGVLHVIGDIGQVGRAWEWLFRSWLPTSGYEPTLEPAVEVFLKSPEEIGWDRFDLLCAIPITPLRATTF